MIRYDKEDIKLIIGCFIDKFANCDNLSDKRKRIKEIKDMLDIMYKLDSEEVKKEPNSLRNLGKKNHRKKSPF